MFSNVVLTRYAVRQNIYMLSSRYIYIYIRCPLCMPRGQQYTCGCIYNLHNRINVVKIIRIDYMNIYIIRNIHGITK